MSSAVVSGRKVGPYQVITYLVCCPATGHGVIIDPAGEEDELAAWVREQGVKVDWILNTHGHPDHTLGNAKLKQLLDARVAMHEADDDFFASPQGQAVATQELGLNPPPPADMRLGDGQVLKVGEMEIQVIHTPGHTPGSVCFLVDGHLFSGDTLFVGAVGRTDLGGASLDTLLVSLENKLLPLPDNTVLHPGHDYGETPTSTLGREKQENPYITDFILDT
jgi:glyoxylase-like metal-dependent hydrolase (beta-lactamase superfamily II)